MNRFLEWVTCSASVSFDGQVRAFAHFGVVPHRIAYGPRSSGDHCPLLVYSSLLTPDRKLHDARAAREALTWQTQFEREVQPWEYLVPGVDSKRPMPTRGRAARKR